MKNVIYTYYNMLVNELNRENDNYYFYFNNYLYYFYMVENDVNVIKDIYNFIKNNNVDCYEIIYNKDNNIVCLINNKNYALIKIEGILKYEIKFDDMKYYQIDREPSNWGKLWGNRLDYYEIQLRELGFKYQTVLNSYGLFAGLAENAILYYNLSIKNFSIDEKIVAVVHNRMKYPCYLIDYNNPLNFVVDYNIRDIAEYIKSYVMSNDYDLDNVLIMLSRLNVNNLMFNLLYSRLLYPTFYFDIYDKIILEDGNDSDIVVILNRVDDYFEMLRSVYNRFNRKYNMFNIEWLNKNVEI